MSLEDRMRSPPCAYASFIRMPRNTLAGFPYTVKAIKHAMGESPPCAREFATAP